MPARNDPPISDESEGLPSLQDDRLRLRGVRGNDLQDFFDLHADRQVMRYWSFPAWTQLEQAQERLAAAIASRDPGRMLCWAVVEPAPDRLIGTVTLFAISPAQGRAEIGYALRASHWGRGLAGDALRMVLDHAFGQLALRRIEADADPRNARSCRLLERLGFAREGLLRERWQVAGEVQDAALYGLLARDWSARRRQASPDQS